RVGPNGTGRIGKGRRSFLLGETVALDLELGVTGRRSAVVPDELDPSFDTLKIWYETPMGERLLYRSRNVLCRTGRPRVKLSGNATLRNNPRVSIGRKGATFRWPGEYRLWAEFGGLDGHFRRKVVSNVASLEVREPRSDEEREIAWTLRQPGMAACVADKNGRLRAAERRLLTRLVRRHPNHPALQQVRYALAHHHARTSQPALAAEFLDG